MNEHLKQAVTEYHRRNPNSSDAISHLSNSLPGGDTRATTWFEPFPLVIDEAHGAEMHDLDGHALLDFIGNFTSLVHGHAPSSVVSAIEKDVGRGTVFASPMAEQGRLAALLSGRVKSVELVRFTNSGTEANMLAARIARVVTGRQNLAVARHSYHGSWSDLDWRQTETAGTLTFPVNDIANTRSLLDGTDLAAIFIEPVLGSGGIIPLTREYLQFLRDYADESGALLVIDEVMTLRLSVGGAQELLSVKPDITTFGKLIGGGGLPIGAVGGSSEIMGCTDPSSANPLIHSGTFNGNRLSVVGGIAALEALDAEAIDRINMLGEKLSRGIVERVKKFGLPISVTSFGSMLNIHAHPDVSTPEDAYAASIQPMKRLLHLKFLEYGIFMAPRGEMCINTAMDENTITQTLDAIESVFKTIS